MAILLKDCGDPEKIKALKRNKRFISGCQEQRRVWGLVLTHRWTKEHLESENILYVRLIVLNTCTYFKIHSTVHLKWMNFIQCLYVPIPVLTQLFLKSVEAPLPVAVLTVLIQPETSHQQLGR